jgi:hypothetical protein
MSAGRKAKDPLDRYWTPREPTSLFLREWRHPYGDKCLILEPAAGAGHMVDVLKECYPKAKIVARDVEPHRDDIEQRDFLTLAYRGKSRMPQLIITNPPFRLAEQFLRQAMREVEPGGDVVFLLRAAFLETKRRENLLAEFPPTLVYFLRKRPQFTGPNPGKGNDSSMYAWIVWRDGYRPSTFIGKVI